MSDIEQRVTDLEKAVAMLTEIMVGDQQQDLTPVPGQFWIRGRQPEFAWRICAVQFGRVHMELYREGQLVDSYMDWPIDRWAHLVDMEDLRLAAKPGRERNDG